MTTTTTTCSFISSERLKDFPGSIFGLLLRAGVCICTRRSAAADEYCWGDGDIMEAAGGLENSVGNYFSVENGFLAEVIRWVI